MLADTGPLTAEELHYAPQTQGWLKRQLARTGLLPSVRSLWRVFLRFDKALEPRTEASVETHVRRLAEHLHREFDHPVGILDLGGGSGPYKDRLVREGDMYAIVEIDPDSAVVTENTERNVYIVGNIHRLPLQPESFDVVCLFEVLEHLYDPFKTIGDCARVLRPGGALVLTVPQYWHVHGWPSDYYRYTINGLRHLCRSAGLEIEHYWPMGGPFLLLAAVVELNFSGLVHLPVVRQLLSFPAIKLCDLADKIFFRNNLQRKHPDTRGWSLIARKPNPQ
jgi:SAM-dependent methyltransferase